MSERRQKKEKSVIDDTNKFIFSLKTADNELLIDSNNPDKDIIYELLSLLRDTKDDVSTIQERCRHSKTARDFIYSFTNFDNERLEIDSEQDRLISGVQWAESSVACRFCHQNSVVYYEKQTRSADEPMTVFYLCRKCGKRWKQ